MKPDTTNHLGLFTHYDELEGAIFLPNGEALLKSLIDKWREMHTQMGFHFIHTFSPIAPEKMHKLVFQKERYHTTARLASFGQNESDFSSIFCKKAAVYEEIISSLHFLEQTIKIFGFETRVYLLVPTGDIGQLLKKALEEKKISYQEESSPLANRVDFRLIDAKRGVHIASFLSVELLGDGIFWIQRSLFGSMKKWMELLVEQTRSKKA